MKKRKISPYMYILPAFIVLAVVIIYPIIDVVYESFFTSFAGEDVFVGFRNYKLVLEDEVFWIAIKNNLKLFLCVPVLTIISLLIAALLNSKIRGWRFYRSIIFVPYILAIPVVGIVFSYLFQYNGVVNTILKEIGLGNLAVDWLGNPDLAFPTVAFVIIWKQAGFGVILFLARMMSIDATLYEAADVDGASWFRKFFSITIPQTKSISNFM